MSEVSAEPAQTDQTDEAKVIQFLRLNPEVLMNYPRFSLRWQFHIRPAAPPRWWSAS